MDKLQVYKKFCTGCGLCHSVRRVEFSQNEKAFLYPKLKKEDLALCDQVCPASGNRSAGLKESKWGSFQEFYVGWSVDQSVRRQASSGGVLTSLCCFLLDNKLVDGVIQTKRDSNIPYMTQTVVSKTLDEVKLCSGSRYSNSSPLYEILDLVDEGKQYAFVGKPCDVYSLKKYLESYRANIDIKYYLSFFCAGIPSENAQKLLVSKLMTNNQICVKLDYRGNGWPGYATAQFKDGSTNSMSYNDSWGNILGRDVRYSCKFCIDGIGEFADISCADAWYLSEKDVPDFSEHEGRNAIFVRSSAGKELIDKAEKNNYVIINKDEHYLANFDKVQSYQKERRGAMISTVYALKLFRKLSPFYEPYELNQLSKNITMDIKVRRFLGTIKRILKGKI